LERFNEYLKWVKMEVAQEKFNVFNFTRKERKVITKDVQIKPTGEYQLIYVNFNGSSKASTIGSVQAAFGSVRPRPLGLSRPRLDGLPLFLA
jgi:hypothetical protein